MSAPYVLVWEFQVRPGCEAAFEDAYGPRGTWAALFERAPDYLGTELLRDADRPGRYLTIDRWASVDAFARFKREHHDDYDELDARCEPWTESEANIGAWTAVDE